MFFAPLLYESLRRGLMHPTSHMQQQLARLEFINDQLTTELEHVNELLCSLGFPEGLTTIKAIAEEVLSDDEPLLD
ncbi:hypothetical protein CpB0753 [Chlamydia pneumoniae TW-183]|uniref:Uncharacterized protein n=3 Tax=Chlamydia pneumoniae TaxID=83558 RepID=Q9Z7I0_CHLPN|nr:CT652.1 hypothetical protein [Chlamydia pneumoniae CWL029]AAF37917.1 conserved hypothetical protein [Chlamydia pneumoniae AR39]AAP98682.1 hypothetical protein CpB0753 [Chlamydia pneumoniae TW-183]ACZ32613.1 conserved hypothetical protein [Chlamydia pneumoniae LPCoLN]CRI33245.1 Uncharacterized protein BN1224_Wien1_A_07520 [Chlamydia pneumoniae]BAA98932.1 CT652.1 hypothetical protein [Chlamydia pneumoniae J138]